MAQSRTILVVDDDPNVLQTVETYLADREYRVVKASLWTEAIAELDEAFPDAVLLDLHLPTVHGEALLAFIRQTHEHLPVIIIASDITPAEMARLSDLGASGFIRKPFETDDLLVVLEQVLVDLTTVSLASTRGRSAPDYVAEPEPASKTGSEAPPEYAPETPVASQLPPNIVPGSGVQDLARRPRPAAAPAQSVERQRKRVRKKKKWHTGGSRVDRVRNYALIIVFFFMIAALLYVMQRGLDIGFLGGITFNKSVSTQPQTP